MVRLRLSKSYRLQLWFPPSALQVVPNQLMQLTWASKAIKAGMWVQSVWLLGVNTCTHCSHVCWLQFSTVVSCYFSFNRFLVAFFESVWDMVFAPYNFDKSKNCCQKGGKCLPLHKGLLMKLYWDQTCAFANHFRSGSTCQIVCFQKLWTHKAFGRSSNLRLEQNIQLLSALWMQQ